MPKKIGCVPMDGMWFINKRINVMRRSMPKIDAEDRKIHTEDRLGAKNVRRRSKQRGLQQQENVQGFESKPSRA